MTDTIDQMDDSLSDETENLLSIIDFPNKRWKKSRIHCNRLRTKAKAIEKINEVKMEVLRAFVEHKEQFHEEVDPASLKPISKVFDLRWWGILFLQHADEKNTTL